MLGSKPQQQAQEAFEITFEEQGEFENKGKEQEIAIKELGDGEGEPPTNFYWGVGVEGYYASEGFFIGSVATGYPADLAGLGPGDTITLINGEPAGSGDGLRGDGPKKLVLTILRKGAIIIVNLERGKVYY